MTQNWYLGKKSVKSEKTKNIRTVWKVSNNSVYLVKNAQYTEIEQNMNIRIRKILPSFYLTGSSG